MLKKAALLSYAAGLFIGIGGTVFLSCSDKVVGAIFFSVALLSICCMKLYLFTGKIGYLVLSHKGSDVAEVLVTLFGNLLGTLTVGLLVPIAKPAVLDAALASSAAKLAMAPVPVLIAGFFCGILMYTAVAVYKENKSPLGIFFCVPVFILCGFEHSIADMFYLFAARQFSLDTLVFLSLVVIGNSLGGWCIPAFRKLAGEV